MTRDDLREVRALGWMQQSLFGIGSFLFSGAFWLVIELIAHQEEERGKFELTAWMGMCFLSMIAGGVLVGVGLLLFRLREKRLDKFFKDEPDI